MLSFYYAKSSFRFQSDIAFITEIVSKKTVVKKEKLARTIGFYLRCLLCGVLIFSAIKIYNKLFYLLKIILVIIDWLTKF